MTRVFERPPEAIITLLVLFARPRDYPQHYVVRAQATFRGETEARNHPLAVLFPEEASARAWLARQYPDFTEFGRYDNDNPNIVSVWL